MSGNLGPSFRRALVVTAALLALAATAPADEYYYAIEVNGVLCGYGRLVTAPVGGGARSLTRLTHELVIKGTILGAPVDSRLDMTYDLDPAGGGFTYHDSTITQGEVRLRSEIRIQGRVARISGDASEREQVLDLPEGVVLDNTLFHPHLVADFADRKLQTRTYLLFDGRDGAVRETTYTRTGAETIQRAGRTFDTIVLDSIDHKTGLKATTWLDPKTGINIEVRQPGNRRTYLAEPSVVNEVRFASFDSVAVSKANIAIPNFRKLSSLSVRATLEPSGLTPTPDSLNVPGQRFTGTVQRNVIDGVFEIEPRRYDGAQAPPFPPDFGGQASLREYLTARGFIQSDDPVLAARAREITNGARDSWDAAHRISEWVAQNIRGAIPGGVTARGTYDQRAGECGGHSFLVAALCRSVGIPARAVWGCAYTRYGGGAFVQHVWNEVYMGDAGWISMDATFKETDYVDAGHIRLGIHESVATVLGPKKFEIISHTISPAQ